MQTSSASARNSSTSAGLTPAHFFALLYPDAARGWLTICSFDHAGRLRSDWFPAGAWGDAERAAHRAAATGRNVYYSVALIDRDARLAAAPGRNPAALRGTIETAVALPGLFVEIDFRAPQHAATNLPPTLDDALALARRFPLPPTLIVLSGGGIHAYWLFNELWTFGSPAERAAATTLLRRFQATIRGYAAQRGWHVDPTADLARILRVPGTTNYNANPPRPVQVLDVAPGRRYNASDFERYLLDDLADDVADGQRDRDAEETFDADAERIVAGCAWLKHCYDDAETITEPEWYRALGILGRCADGQRLAHAWSARDPRRYAPEDTDKKLKHALEAAGPATCAYIEEELGSTYCARCEHRGKIKSPIVLGRDDGARLLIAPRAAGNRPSADGMYGVQNGGIVRVTQERHGEQVIEIVKPLTNFTARIVADVARDDGSGEIERVFELEATLGPRRRRFTVPAASFANMGWAVEHLGAGAIVYPGQAVREHARVAIQVLSGDVPERRVFTHTGWREVDGQRVYLHAGGAIGRVGRVADLTIDLPGELSRLVLPEPPTGPVRAAAIRASLGLLDVAPDRVTAPVLAAVYRAVLGTTDFSLHLAGETGVGKTEFAALAQQHFGPGFDSRHLPASWLSTGNALEALAFAAKDCLIVVDDFAPGGGPQDIARLHREADRLLRAQGNAAGRLRLRPDATLRPARPPRGLILSTGEDVPRGQSLRARALILEIERGDLDWRRLGQCQEDAAAGVYANALAAFIQWVAARYDDIQAMLRAETAALRQRAYQDGQHRRTPAIVASLGAGIRVFLAFARAVAALTDAEAAALWARAWRALGEAAQAQAEQQAASEPARRFLDLLIGALASGRVHLAGPAGDAPPNAGAWGWRADSTGTWRPLGDRIGWIDDEDVYLEPEASYVAVQRLARDGGGEGLTVSAATLRRRLHQRGILASRDDTRKTLTVRRVLEAQRREVLHLRASSLSAQQPDQPDHDPENVVSGRQNWTVDGRGSWSGFVDDGAKPDQETRPRSQAKLPETDGLGRDGQVGQVSRTDDTPPRAVDWEDF